MWLETITAAPGDILQFKIEITNIGGNPAKNVIIKDIFPNKVNYWGSLKINDVPQSGAIWLGMNMGDIPVGQKKIITFDAKVGLSEDFGYGSTILNNLATVSGENLFPIEDTAVIDVRKAGVAGAVTEVNTGAIKPVMFVFFTSLLLLILFIGFWAINRFLVHSSKFWRNVDEKFQLLKSYIFSE